MDLLDDDLVGKVLQVMVIVYCCNVVIGCNIDLGVSGCDVVLDIYGGSVFCVSNLCLGWYCGSNEVVVSYWMVQIEK